MRDAFVVGATVTATHTAGVIVLGLALTLSSSLAGDAVLRWLGVSSGMLVAGLGASLLVNAIRHKTPAHGHRHGFGNHSHSHAPTRAGSHAGHDHTEHDHADERADVLVHAGHDPEPGHSTGSNHEHDHSPDLGHHRQSPRPRPSNRTTQSPPPRPRSRPQPRARPPRRRAPGAESSRARRDGHRRRAGASPSALVVLLAAIALGRTIFGVRAGPLLRDRHGRHVDSPPA